jgi:CRP-like cAMP-binding protein
MMRILWVCRWNPEDGTLQFQKHETVFCQGDRAEAIYFIQTGKVKIAVVSPAGKEAVLHD